MYTATNDNPGQPYIEFGEVKPGIFDTNVNIKKCANVSLNVPVFSPLSSNTCCGFKRTGEITENYTKMFISIL